jgi:hypothetical protein
MNKAILVATIGTRDLMFQVASGSWYNIGDDRMQDGDIIGEQAEVIADLGFGTISYRDLTHYLVQHAAQYSDRIKPVILGKLLSDSATQLECLYLIGTDQQSQVYERHKDTLHSCALIKAWVEQQHQIPVEILHLGSDGTNPSNFEAMFRWWRRSWRETIRIQQGQSVWLCLKGGVGQASEAGRISGLSLYGDRIKFFEFQQNVKNNQKGLPSDYSGPFLGTNYLWDRTQQQALRLLQRFDYAGAEALLLPYFQQDAAGFGVLPTFIKAGVAWNRGEFETFFKLVKQTLMVAEQRREQTWWWMAYEQAYLGVVRLEQTNTAESMLHSFRSVEGALWQWAIATFPHHVQAIPDKFSLLLPSILQVYPSLAATYNRWKGDYPNAQLRGGLLQALLEVAIPQATGRDFQAFWSEDCRNMRNALSHQLGGLSLQQVLKAWGQEIRTQAQWETRILTCLNLLAGQSFKALKQGSLFYLVHTKVIAAIAAHELQN